MQREIASGPGILRTSIGLPFVRRDSFLALRLIRLWLMPLPGSFRGGETGTIFVVSGFLYAFIFYRIGGHIYPIPFETSKPVETYASELSLERLSHASRFAI